MIFEYTVQLPPGLHNGRQAAVVVVVVVVILEDQSRYKLVVLPRANTAHACSSSGKMHN